MYTKYFLEWYELLVECKQTCKKTNKPDLLHLPPHFQYSPAVCHPTHFICSDSLSLLPPVRNVLSSQSKIRAHFTKNRNKQNKWTHKTRVGSKENRGTEAESNVLLAFGIKSSSQEKASLGLKSPSSSMLGRHGFSRDPTRAFWWDLHHYQNILLKIKTEL